MPVRVLILLFACFVLLAQAPAQEEEAEATDAEPIIIEAEDSADADDEESSGAADERAEDDEDRFIPSREVPPDEQVIFPIDI